MEGADEVLALGGVDSGLAAHGGIDHAEDGGGDVDDLDPAQPSGGDESAEVAHRSPADGHDGVGAGEIGLAEDLPAECGDLDVLGLFGVGDLRSHGLEAGGREVVADGLTGGAQGAGVDDEDLLDAVSEQLGQFAEQSLADEDGVVPAGVHIDACEAHSSVFLIVHRLLTRVGRRVGARSRVTCSVGRIQPSPHRCSAAKRLTGLNAVVSPPGLCSALQPQALCSALVMGAVDLGVGVFRVLFGTLETGEHIDDPIDHRRRR